MTAEEVIKLPTFTSGECKLQAFNRYNKGKYFQVMLDKKTWDIKTQKPERYYLVYNFDKVEASLTSPDFIFFDFRYNSLVYYKKLDKILIRPNIIVPFRKTYFAVIVMRNKIMTIYPTDKMMNRGVILWQKAG